MKEKLVFSEIFSLIFNKDNKKIKKYQSGSRQAFLIVQIIIV